MNKEMEFSKHAIYCEGKDCFNMVGYGGALVEHLDSHKRLIVCLPCLKQWYGGWKQLIKWK